jgi:Fe-S-cluster-containing hydrogenase component 2
MVLELSGEDADFKNGMKYLEDTGVRVQPLSEDIVRNSAKCTDCGMCVPICPANAFIIDPASRKVIFEEDKCIACELCIKICPAHAMEINF